MLEMPVFVPVGTGCSFVSEGGKRPVRIELSPEAHETLRMDAVEALRSLPRRGLEIGGVLVGTAGNPLVVEAVQPVDSEHLYGPRYRLSESDSERFTAAFRATKRSPVGLFRTITGEGESGGYGLDPGDQEWMRAHFADREAVLLLVVPKMTGRVILSCYHWDRRGLRLCQEAGTAESKPELVARSKWRNWVQEAGLAALAAVLVFGGIYVTQRHPTSAHAVSAPSPQQPNRGAALGLRAENNAQGARIFWNEKSKLLLGASGALLTMDQGSTHIELPITPAQLQMGSIALAPLRADATFHLAVFRNGDENEIQESVKVAGQAPAIVPRPAPRRILRPSPRSRPASRAELTPPPPPDSPAPAMKLPLPVSSSSASIFPK